MTPEERKRAAEVMTSDGPWQCLEKCAPSRWVDVEVPVFDWNKYDYRVRPQPIVRYVNCYPEKNDNDRIHPTRKQADSAAMNSRLACVRIEFTPGQFDE